MSDRYLFRGKRWDNGEWVYGNLIDFTADSGAAFIFVDPTKGRASTMSYRQIVGMGLQSVDPDTICQCIGRTFSKHLAFEGDIFHIPDEQRDAVIQWDAYTLKFMAVDTKSNEDIWLNEYGDGDMLWIGNVHDNPELLKSGSDEK